MSAGRSGLADPGRRLPAIELPSLADGSPTPLRRPGRRAPLLALVHGLGCPACGSYLRELASRRADLEEWDGRVVVVTADAPGSAGTSAPAVDLPFPVLGDPEGRVAALLSLRVPATVVADQWAEVHEAREAGPDHRFPAVEELVDWARYLAVQCPECQGESL